MAFKSKWKTKLSVCSVIISGIISCNSASAATLDCNTTLYYCNPTGYDVVNVTTSIAGNITGGSGLGGFGVYLSSNSTIVKEINIITSGSAADAIRINSDASYFIADKLSITASGSSADGINVASDFNQDYDAWVYVKGAATITVTDGVGVRANTHQHANSKSVVVLGDDSVIKIVGTGSAANSTDSRGYAVYAGNRDRDLNGIGTIDQIMGKNNNTLGKAYVFVGKNSEISTSTTNGHAVYANKSGVIQLGDGADISTTGNNALAIYASTEQQGTYTDNVRPGHVYLVGGAKLRAANSDDVIKASGVGSIISSQYLTAPVMSDSPARTDRISIDDGVLTDSRGVFDIVGNINAVSGGTVSLNMADGSVFSGSTSVDGASTVNLDIQGTNSIWTMERDSVLTNLMLDGATLKYAEPADLTDPLAFTAKTLTVVGDYSSNNGTLVLNTVLEDDSSATDKLIVQGDTSGHTDVMITNIGGAGAQTINGIEIVEVGGVSAGTFGNSQRIVAGAYDYFVRSGSTINGADANNWYLISDLSPVDPGPDPDPDPDPDPGPGTDPNPEPCPEPEPEPNPEPEIKEPQVYRPEAGSYLANLAASNTMFITRLHDRLGETQYTDVLTGEKKVTSMWMRHVVGQNRFFDSGGDRQLKTSSNRYVTQIGGDIAQWSTDGLDRWHIGLMAGYAKNSNHTRSKLTGYSSRGKVDGYSVGLYGTWYANEADKTGTYLDTWAMYSWFDNEVNGERLKSEKYKSKGVTASIEGGYTFKLGEKDRSSYWLQPKAQVIWMGVTANDYSESNGTRIKHETDNNIMTRLGIRAYGKGHHPIDDGKDREFEPFIELNWLHNTNDYTVKMNETKISQQGAKNLGEVKMGVEGKLNNNLTSWVNVGHQFGKHSYTDTYGMIGVKYSF